MLIGDVGIGGQHLLPGGADPNASGGRKVGSGGLQPVKDICVVQSAVVGEGGEAISRDFGPVVAGLVNGLSVRLLSFVLNEGTQAGIFQGAGRADRGAGAVEKSMQSFTRAGLPSESRRKSRVAGCSSCRHCVTPFCV